MPTLAEPDSSVKAVKLRRERARFERESIKTAVYRAQCLDCDWAWKSEHAAEDAKSAEDRANAHSAAAHHRVDVVFDIIGCHYTSFRSKTELG